MNGRISKLIRRYCSITGQSDYRKDSTAIRPTYVIKQKLNNLNGQNRLNFIQEMKKTIKKYSLSSK